MAPPVGFEPTTYRLTAECSTVELRGNIIKALNHKLQYQCLDIIANDSLNVNNFFDHFKLFLKIK